MAEEVISAGGGGGGSPGGSNTQIQFNDSTSFAGDSNLTFNKTTDTLTTVNLSGSLTRLSDGSSYLVAGNNITITSASNGSVTIASTGGSTNGNLVFNEYVGMGNGSNTLFSLDNTPTANNNVSIFINGLLQMPATSLTGAPFQDYSITGSLIYFTTSSLPDEGSIVMANYTTNDAI